jgi:probable F420-dependent oxidoreductase
MKFGLSFASAVGTDPTSALEICRVAESVGFESVWGGEHVILPTTIESRYPYTADGKIPAVPETEIVDPLIWLAYVAAAAPTLRLGTCILILPQRNPVVLAKELATLDRLSGGRVELGIGIGWMREEFEAIGVPWARRGARTDEYVAAMRALWAGPHAEFHGEFVDFPPVTCSPRPTQANIPIIVGGDTPAAIDRAARLADGYFPGEGDADRLAVLIEQLRTAAEAHGRSLADIEVSANVRPDLADDALVARYAGLGVGRMMIGAFAFFGPDGLDRLRAFGERVVVPNRE